MKGRCETHVKLWLNSPPYASCLMSDPTSTWMTEIFPKICAVVSNSLKPQVLSNMLMCSRKTEKRLCGQYYYQVLLLLPHSNDLVRLCEREYESRLRVISIYSCRRYQESPHSLMTAPKYTIINMRLNVKHICIINDTPSKEPALIIHTFLGHCETTRKGVFSERKCGSQGILAIIVYFGAESLSFSQQ